MNLSLMPEARGREGNIFKENIVDINEIMVRRLACAKRLTRTLAHLPREKVIFIITCHMDLETLECLTAAQEMRD